MSMQTIHLGHCAFDSSKMQIRANVHATASFISNPSLPDVLFDLCSATIHSSRDHWFTRCPKTQIRLQISFDQNLCPRPVDRYSIQQTLASSCEQAQLWFQLGLEAHLDTSTWSLGTETELSTLVIDIVVSTRHVMSGASHPACDSSNVQPPITIPVYIFRSIQFTIDLYQPISMQANASNPKYTHHHVNKTMLSMIDASMRNFICWKPRRTPGISLHGDRRLLSLATLAPSVFMPDHVKQLACRARLIPPIVRFLSAYKSRSDSTRQVQVHDSRRAVGRNSSYSHVNQESTLCIEAISSDLWMTMTNSLAARRPGQRLKPLVFDNSISELNRDIENGRDSILIDQSDEEDHRDILLEDDDAEEPLLREMYDAYQLTQQDKLDGCMLSRLQEQTHSSVPLSYRNQVSGNSGDFDVLVQDLRRVSSKNDEQDAMLRETKLESQICERTDDEADSKRTDFQQTISSLRSSSPMSMLGSDDLPIQDTFLEGCLDNFFEPERMAGSRTLVRQVSNQDQKKPSLLTTNMSPILSQVSDEDITDTSMIGETANSSHWPMFASEWLQHSRQLDRSSEVPFWAGTELYSNAITSRDDDDKVLHRSIEDQDILIDIEQEADIHV